MPREDRRHVDKASDNRSPFERDRDRILYASAFRRLAGITQVVSALEGHVYHNRLTHTLKVAQVARRVAEKLLREAEEIQRSHGAELPAPPLNADVAESAALAHDLGHPPFGHVAEVELQRLVSPLDRANSFEGNAQSFRIVTKIARASPGHVGLNLTRATLNAILKYPWMHDPDDAKAGKKWAAYTTEDDDFRFARELSSSDELPNSGADQSLEAFIMDWADDITYAVHDVEDLYRAGLVPSERLHDSKTARRDFAERVHARWLSRGKQANIEDIDRALLVFPTLFGSSGPYDGTSSQRIAIRMFTSALIGRYVNWTRLEYSSSAGTWTMVIDQSARAEVDVLKELTWRYVIERPALASQQHGQKKVIRELFETFMDAARTPVIEQSTRRSSLLVSAMT